MITYVSFHKPINVAGTDLRDYSRTREGHSIDLVERGNFFVFWRKSKPNEKTRVPLTNIAHIAETVEPDKEPKK